MPTKAKTNGKLQVTSSHREVSPRNKLNDLTAKEWIQETVSVWTQRGLGKNHADAQIERLHPAPFSFQDVARLIRFFTKSGQIVLDPFVGVGSTLKAAALEGRNGIGIELNSRYAKLAEQRLEQELDESLFYDVYQKVINSDARKELPKLEDESIDLVVTSPPYWNILQKKDHKAKQEREKHGLDTQYSDDPRDLGNIKKYSEFISELMQIFTECARCLRTKGHMCVIVGDFRHRTKYYMFHADIMNGLEEIGLVPKGLNILYQRHKRVFPYGYPAAFVPNIHHQYIIIVQKP